MMPKSPPSSNADSSQSKGCYTTKQEEASLTRETINTSPEMRSTDAFPLESFKQEVGDSMGRRACPNSVPSPGSPSQPASSVRCLHLNEAIL